MPIEAPCEACMLAITWTAEEARFARRANIENEGCLRDWAGPGLDRETVKPAKNREPNLAKSYIYVRPPLGGCRPPDPEPYSAGLPPHRPPCWGGFRPQTSCENQC